MATEIRIGDFRTTDEVATYSVTEEVTPLDPTDMSGGVGQITISAESSREIKLAQRRTVLVTDDVNGTVVGTVSSASISNDFGATVTADSRLIALVADRIVPPFAGTLREMLEHCLAICGITSGIVIDEDFTLIPVVAPGWRGSVWDGIKRICQAHQIEVALVSNNIVFRKPRANVAENRRDSQSTVAVDDSRIAQSVVVHYLASCHFGVGLAYPLGGWSEDVRVFSVDAGETLEFDVDVSVQDGDEGPGASLFFVEQPLCVDFVGPNHASSSIYCVAGNDGRPITAAQWNATGGKVEVEIGEDANSLVVRVTGSSIEEYAPYHIAATSGDNNYYSSLRIRGAGAFYEQAKLTMLTGNDEDTAPIEVGAEVSNHYIVGFEAAWRAGSIAAAAWSGRSTSLNVSTRGINRKGDSGSMAYVTVAQVDERHDGLTVAQVDDLHLGLSVHQVDDAWAQDVRNEFENQAFGNVAGARVNAGEYGWMRITQATISPASVTYQASSDLTVRDWDNHYSGMSVDQIDALSADMTAGDLSILPLL